LLHGAGFDDVDITTDPSGRDRVAAGRRGAADSSEAGGNLSEE
jgi:hypothetical protein